MALNCIANQRHGEPLQLDQRARFNMQALR
jgi:hypothetical protein